MDSISVTLWTQPSQLQLLAYCCQTHTTDVLAAALPPHSIPVLKPGANGIIFYLFGGNGTMNHTDILYIEDNGDYIRFVTKAIQKINSGLNFGVVMQGNEALELVNNASDIKDLPRLILLDIDLPDYNGLDLLAEIRANHLARYIPVIMFSSSDDPDDIKKAFDEGANAYLVKPVSLNALTSTLEGICNFWLNLHRPVEIYAA